MPPISIVICTRNRAESLRPTLESFHRAEVPAGWDVELLVVDNGSTDGTRQVVERARLPHIAVRHVFEPTPGQCWARNRGLRESVGSVFLFTDDDVRVPSNWIDAMCRPIVEGRADAVAGGVVIAPHLERSWLRGHLRGWVASTDVCLDASAPERLVGANMAFARHVLDRVPVFDTELGPGALGFFDETLFSAQLLRAGFRISSAFDARVEHHFDEARLSFAALQSVAERLGRSWSYKYYHWDHGKVRAASVRWLAARVGRALAQVRARRASEPTMARLGAWFRFGLLDQYLVESKRARNYDKFGLVKKSGQFAGNAAGGY